MANLPDLHQKQTKASAIWSSGFLLGLATSDKYAFLPEERIAIHDTGCFLATLAGRADLIPEPYRCPRCGAVSHNPRDKAEGYCGACHVFEGDGLPTGPTS
jgi:hypothetical protein